MTFCTQSADSPGAAMKRAWLLASRDRAHANHDATEGLAMDHTTKRRSILSIVAIFFALLSGTAIGLFALVAMTTSVSGTATLPNGITAVIHGPFSCSGIPPTTKIEAGGHTFTFSPTTISVDGRQVGPLDANVTSVQIDTNYWSTSLRVNGGTVAIYR